MGPLVRHALRDAALLAGTFAAWRADAALRGARGLVPVVVACAAGLLTALAGYLAHEWGHWLGARAGRSVVHVSEGTASVFLFRFDSDRNGRAQFLAMSLGGFAASALVVAGLVAALPMHALSGRVALGLTALGVLATALLELPPFFRVARGGPIPRGAAYRSDAVGA